MSRPADGRARRGDRWCRCLVLALLLTCLSGCEFVRNEFFFIDVAAPAPGPAPDAAHGVQRSW